ncbi:MAG: hypothetical protein AMXMBFR64_40970 [Myxococcales bacterium]
MRRRVLVALWSISVGLHVAAGAAVSTLEDEEVVPDPVPIQLVEVAKKPEPPKPEPPKQEPPKPAEPPKAEAPKAEVPAPPVVEAPPPEAPPPPKPPKPKAPPKAPPPAAAKAPPGKGPRVPVDLGGSMSGGSLGVPVGGDGDGDTGAGQEVASVGPLPTPATRTVTRTLEPAPKKKKKETGCDEPASKPRPLSIPQPRFPEAARAAGVQGKVRVELTVGAEGRVVKARVLQGLGHGLDEAALAAAREGRFEPAMQCGKPVPSTFVIAIRFTI